MGLSGGRLPGRENWQAATLRCACAVALVALLVLLQQPDAAVGQELQVQQPLWPRAASWLPSFSHLNKYFEKLFGNSMKSKKSKDAKKPDTPPANATKPLQANAVKPLSENAMKLPQQNSTNPAPRNSMKP